MFAVWMEDGQPQGLPLQGWFDLHDHFLQFLVVAHFSLFALLTLR